MPDFSEKESKADRAAWNEALQRTRLYLSGVLRGDDWHLTQTSLVLLEEARRRHGADPGKPPLEHALQAAEEHLLNNLRSSNLEKSGEKRVLEEEIVLHFMARMEPTADGNGQLSKLKGRSLAVSSMTARPIDYGPLVAADTGMEKEWKPVVGVAAFWFAFYWVVYLVFALKERGP